MPQKLKRVVFDIETEPFSETFRTSRTKKERTKEAPSMRLACLYDESANKYYFFLPEDVKELISLLRSADEVISFNGNRFDLLVLRRHYKLPGNIPNKGKHVDLCQIMKNKGGFYVSLYESAKLNLGKGKHTLGRNISQLNLAGLRAACRSDVSQTYELWKLYKAGTLKYPSKNSRSDSVLDIDEPGPPHPILDYAELAGSYNPGEISYMSEGEQAEYYALLEGGGDIGWAADMFGLDLDNYHQWRSQAKLPRKLSSKAGQDKKQGRRTSAIRRR